MPPPDIRQFVVGDEDKEIVVLRINKTKYASKISILLSKSCVSYRQRNYFLDVVVLRGCN